MLELILFGNMEIRRAGVLVTDFKSIKAQALLCYLAVTGQPHTRSELAGLLWGGMPETNARMNLSQALSTSRRFIGNFLNIKRQTIALRQDSDIWIDVNIFEENVIGNSGEVDIPALQEAVQLYRGDFLDSFYVRKAPEFESWVMTERARLRELAVKTLQTLATHYSGQGETGWAEAIDYTARRLTIEPWQEDAHRLMMRLLALSGQRSAALKQFEECRKILIDELDVEPSPSTVRLLERIRQGEFDPESALDDIGKVDAIKSMPSTHQRKHLDSNLPLLANLLIGRQRETEKLNQYLTDPDVRLVTIMGPGGIGKTHLALSVAHQLKESDGFRDGIFFIPLSSVTTHYRLISTIAKQLGLALAGSRQPEGVLFDFLRDKACILVLDNFEQLLPEIDFLTRLLQVAPQCKILVTSRERLKLREEWVLDLEGLPYPDTIQEAQTSDYDAILLFSERARQIRSKFSLEKEIPGVVRICQMTQGMPLALEQAASLIRVSQTTEIADQIEERLDTLSTTLRNLPERHRSMRAVFDESWRWLSEDEQGVFSRLSVFRGGFTREAAEQVSGASLTTLTSLVDKSLLRIGIGHGESIRYDLHELVGQYAAERLLEAGQAETTQTHEAHLNFFLSLAERAEKFNDTEKEKEWLERLEVERGNLHTALWWVNENMKTEHALRLNAALINFWVYNSPAGEASDWLESSLSLAWDKRSRATMRARAKALIVAGYAALQISDLELASMRFEEAAELSSTLGDQRRLTWSMRGSGFVCLIRGDLKDAQAFFDESRSICQDIQNEGGLVWSVYELGNVALARAELTQAELLLEAALVQFREQGRELGTFRALISLGHLRRAQGKWAESKILYREALAIQDDTHYLQFVAQILEGFGHIAVAERNMKIAVQFFGAAQARRDSVEMKRWKHQDIEYQRSLALTRDRLPDSAWQSAWDEGYNMAPQHALDYVMADKSLGIE